MSLEDVFPSPELTSTELETIAIRLSDPLIKKYLRMLALSDMKELLSTSSIAATEHTISQAFAVVQGRTEVISALLSIEAPERSPLPQESN